MEVIVYALCALTALTCAGLLLRSYARSRHRLLLWSGICFVGLFLNNVVVILDSYVFPMKDLTTWRLGIGLTALLPLLYALIWEGE